jgi:hypothetical protein
MPLKAKHVQIIVVVVVVLLGCGAGLHAVMLDGLDGVFFGLALREDTQYVPGYSDKAFRAVRPGMSSQQVLELLGQPLQRVPLGVLSETWRYSRSPSEGHYRLRAVQLRHDRVVAVFHEFHVD